MDKSAHSRWRRNRPHANVLDQVAQPTPTPLAHPSKPMAAGLERAPPPPPPSRMSLFNLFSKPKVEKARGHSEGGLAVPTHAAPLRNPPPPSPPKSALRPNPSPAVQQAHRSRSSQMLRPMSLRPMSVKRSPDNWAPPPLFQAYPLAIKHATVQACVFSPDVLLRTQSQRKQHDLLRERMDSHRDLAATLDSEPKRLEKSHKRLLSNALPNTPTPQLTSKIYVLAVSGHVLQYSGDGSVDRLPEKVLKLGKESAAFACDLIPGKHWVLQISQSANEDGTVSIGPKHSILSRLKLQNASERRAASSFLLVLESAEEMDSWMTAVRKEIDHLGGMRAREEPVREPSSIEEETEEQSQESTGPAHQHLAHRSTNRTRNAPVDSPFQSQYFESPKIVTSEWKGDRGEKTASIADAVSVESYLHSSTMRISADVSSIATTPVSTDQSQLDQLRERSRFSYVSTATSISGTGTRSTSRNSSPAPNSPLREGFATVEHEQLRSATSLRSFHMSPSNAVSARRRSIQPLPVTNEDSSLSAGTPSVTAQRHSSYSPTSPLFKTSEQAPAKTAISDISIPSPSTASNPALAQYASAHAPCPTARTSVRCSTRSSSAPPVWNSVLSPPPRDPAPPPGQPQSTVESLPITTTYPSRSNRLSQNPKPFFRPIPVRPQNADGSFVVPRRYSSLSPTPAPLPLSVVVNRSTTMPLRPPSAAAALPSQNEFKTTHAASQQLRRPSSVQIRSDPAPFLSFSRPVVASSRAISSTPSFVPGKRVSSTPAIRAPLSNPALRDETAQRAQPAQRTMTPRRSMPVIALPPPAPPPTMPLPLPPPMANTKSVVV